MAVVLVVDDEKDLCELSRIGLKCYGVDCEMAYDIATAKQLLAQQDFDLCITDIKLPDGNGLELVKHINAEYSALTVIVATGYANEQLIEQALAAGAKQVVAKPIGMAEIEGFLASDTI